MYEWSTKAISAVLVRCLDQFWFRFVDFCVKTQKLKKSSKEFTRRKPSQSSFVYVHSVSLLAMVSDQKWAKEKPCLRSRGAWALPGRCLCSRGRKWKNSSKISATCALTPALSRARWSLPTIGSTSSQMTQQTQPRRLPSSICPWGSFQRYQDKLWFVKLFI